MAELTPEIREELIKFLQGRVVVVRASLGASLREEKRLSGMLSAQMQRTQDYNDEIESLKHQIDHPEEVSESDIAMSIKKVHGQTPTTKVDK